GGEASDNNHPRISESQSDRPGVFAVVLSSRLDAKERVPVLDLKRATAESPRNPLQRTAIGAGRQDLFLFSRGARGSRRPSAAPPAANLPRERLQFHSSCRLFRERPAARTRW